MSEKYIVTLCKRPNKANQRLKTAAIIGGIAAGTILAPLAVVGAVGALGFGAAGVTAGSVAAAIQSAVYGGSVASGSIFAICQSIGAAGLGVVGAASSAAAGATAGGIIGGISTKNISSNSKKIKISVSDLRKLSVEDLIAYIRVIAPDSKSTILLQLMDKSPIKVKEYSEKLKKVEQFDDADEPEAEKTAFKDTDVAFLFDETTDRERNHDIFKEFGEAIERHAKKSVKVIIIGSEEYCEENRKTCRDFALSIPEENFLTEIKVIDASNSEA